MVFSDSQYDFVSNRIMFCVSSTVLCRCYEDVMDIFNFKVRIEPFEGSWYFINTTFKGTNSQTQAVQPTEESPALKNQTAIIETHGIEESHRRGNTQLHLKVTANSFENANVHIWTKNADCWKEE